jgi:crotonobetainyl-CoA:carnitine CoA-transferase CaiB-like acyl-CoA transferase
VVGRPEWLNIESFATEKLRVKNRAQLSEIIAALFKTKPVAHWVDLLNDAGVPAGPVYSVPEMFNDPQVQHLKVAHKMNTPQGPVAGLITQPVQLDRTPAAIATTAPAWGEHTDEVLREAGYDEAGIADLRERGVV